MKSILSLLIALGLQAVACGETLRFFVLPEKAASPEVLSSLQAFQAKTPDLGTVALEINSLARVTLSKQKTSSAMMDKDGKVTKEWSDEVPAISVMLPPDGREKFTKLTETNVGHRIMIVVGDRILGAPFLRTPIKTSSFQIALGASTTVEDTTRIVDALRSMVNPAGPEVIGAATSLDIPKSFTGFSALKTSGDYQKVLDAITIKPRRGRLSAEDLSGVNSILCNFDNLAQADKLGPVFISSSCDLYLSLETSLSEVPGWDIIDQHATDTGKVDIIGIEVLISATQQKK